MKIYEVSNTSDSHKIQDFLKKFCQEFIEESRDVPLYRGYPFEKVQNRFTESPLSFIASPKIARSPRSTSIVKHEKLVQAISDLGADANRDNSFFVTGSPASASQYGEIFRIYPIGSYTYTWFEEIDDMFSDMPVYFFEKAMWLFDFIQDRDVMRKIRNEYRDTEWLQKFSWGGEYEKASMIQLKLIEGDVFLTDLYRQFSSQKEQEGANYMTSWLKNQNININKNLHLAILSGNEIMMKADQFLLIRNVDLK